MPRAMWTAMLTGFSLAAQAGAAATSAIATDHYIDSEMRTQHIPGIALAVYKRGRPIYVKSYGVATLEHNVAVQPQTLFQIGSIGKQFTAVAIMLLANEHRLSLDDPLSKYLPEVPDNWQAVTLRRMLNHQSGIAQLLDDDHHLLDLRREYSDLELIRLAASQRLDFVPGTNSEYSDTAYVLLGIVINRVTGTFYGDYLQTHVFKPLGMGRTRIISDADIIPDRASGYELSASGALQNQGWVSVSLNRTADGSLYSTVLDLGRWDAALYGDAVLAQADLSRMWRVDSFVNGQRPLYNYGYGWEINSLRGERVIEYDGNWQGFQAAMARYPERQLTVVVLTNRSLCRTQRLVHAVAGLFDHHLVPYGVAPHDADPARTRAFAQQLDEVLAGRNSQAWGPALAHELKSVGPIRSVTLSEEMVSPGNDARVYRVELAQMVDYLTVRYSSDGSIDNLQVYREY